MPSLAQKKVKGITYLQFINGDTLIHCGRADSTISWRRAYNLYVETMRLKIANMLISKGNDFESSVSEVCKKISKNDEDSKWLEKQIRKLRND